MNLRKGFSLIELLVVIAVIGILAGIAFPVFSRAKDSAYRSSDMSKMNDLRTALQLYKTDQGAYPPALLGYATGYMSDGTVGDPQPTTANIVPADKLPGPLYPKRVPGINNFQPAYLRQGGSSFMRLFDQAVWPASTSINSAAGQPNQRYGPDTVASRCADTNGNGVIDSGDTAIPRLYYRLSGFDAASVRNSTGGTQHELRYTLFWSGWTVPANPCAPTAQELGSATDDPRQLGYSDPPDTTVVTWDSFFREYENNNTVTSGKRDIVLFLGGSARMFDSRRVVAEAYKVTP